MRLPWQSKAAAARPAAEGPWLLAEFTTPDAVLAAADAVRRTGTTRWDVHSPFPVHGLERAMGLKASLVPWFVLILGLAGAAAGMGLQWWASTIAYPLVVSGKPMFSWPAFVPIMFECGVLGGALGAVGGLLFEARLPRHHHPLFASKRFERMSDDRFFVSVDTADPNAGEAEGLLRRAGAVHVERLATEAPAPEGRA
ncbi:MAG TPA: DUF3341 domain-containing protein [Thermoanaerobaculia bacterium]|nr:DUF3341 domain-containing protein [Thermoanaerobaculia bacterium]